jgi:hypothetical protein
MGYSEIDRNQDLVGRFRQLGSRTVENFPSDLTVCKLWTPQTKCEVCCAACKLKMHVISF